MRTSLRKAQHRRWWRWWQMSAMSLLCLVWPWPRKSLHSSLHMWLEATTPTRSDKCQLCRHHTGGQLHGIDTIQHCNALFLYLSACKSDKEIRTSNSGLFWTRWRGLSFSHSRLSQQLLSTNNDQLTHWGSRGPALLSANRLKFKVNLWEYTPSPTIAADDNSLTKCHILCAPVQSQNKAAMVVVHSLPILLFSVHQQGQVGTFCSGSNPWAVQPGPLSLFTIRTPTLLIGCCSQEHPAWVQKWEQRSWGSKQRSQGRRGQGQGWPGFQVARLSGWPGLEVRLAWQGGWGWRKTDSCLDSQACLLCISLPWPA